MTNANGDFVSFGILGTIGTIGTIGMFGTFGTFASVSYVRSPLVNSLGGSVI